MLQKSEVERVAELARLELTGEEIVLYTEQLNSILDYIHSIEQVDCSLVQSISPALTSVLREDVLEESLEAELILAEAPVREAQYFVTPTILGSWEKV